GTEAVIDLFKSVGYREGAQRLSRVLLARRGLEPTVKAIEQATKGIDAWHLGEKAMKPLHEMGGSHAHHTQSTISAGIKKAGGTTISTTRLQLRKPTLRIPTAHRPSLGNFHLRAPHRTFAPPRHVVRSAIRPAFRR